MTRRTPSTMPSSVPPDGNEDELLSQLVTADSSRRRKVGMDPDANLAEQIRLSERVLLEVATDNEKARLADLVISLNDWIRGGGFLPKAWQRRI